jgi:alkanesulfonate monooxygenase
LKKAVSVGIHVPSVAVAGLADGQAYADYFRAIEDLGLDAVWVEDRIFHPAPLADSLTLLTWAAASTRKIQLGTAVMMLNLRQAPVVARQISTLQHLSDGRVTLGISIGGRAEEYQALGVPMDRRVGVFRESIAVLREMLSGETISRDSAYFPLNEVAIRPAAPTPILIGGIVEGAIKRAGELGDGWIMGPFGGVEEFKAGWALARDGARAAGKNPDDLTAGRLIYVAIDNDKARAEADITAFLHGYYGPDFGVEKHAVCGPPGEVAARLRELVDAGLTHLMLGVPSLDHGHLRRLAEEVAPALR